MFIGLFVIFHFSPSIVIASGGYDNGTATGKGRLGLDLTWNPFNYFPEGQSYIVASYGFSEKFDIHGYYSIPASGSDNYYLGLFYQFHKNKYLDLATAIGIINYIAEKSNEEINIESSNSIMSFIKKIKDKLTSWY